MVVLIMECLCEQCGKATCQLTVSVDVEKGKKYRTPNKCPFSGDKVNWIVESIEVDYELG